MTHHVDIFDELAMFEAETGIKAATVCRKATGNPRLYERLPRKISTLDADISAIRDYMRNYRRHDADPARD